MNADAAQEDWLAIEENLRALGLNGAEADLVGDLESAPAFTRPTLYNFGVSGDQKIQALRVKLDRSATVLAYLAGRSSLQLRHFNIYCLSGMSTLTCTQPSMRLWLGLAEMCRSY